MGAILRRVNEQRKLLWRIRQVLPAELAPHLVHAESLGGDLVLFFDSSSWASLARYQAQEVLTALRGQVQPTPRRCRFRVAQPPAAQPAARRRALRLSASGAAAIAGAADAVADPALRASLARLAARGERGAG